MGNQHSIQRRSSDRGLKSHFQLKRLIPKSYFKNLTDITEESNDVAGTDYGSGSSLTEESNDVAGTDYGSGSSLTGHEGSKNEQEDGISKIPDDILKSILSLLPTHDAIKTLVIKTFGDNWSSTDNLDFDLCLYHDSSSCDDLDVLSVDEKFVNLVGNILIHHKSLKIFNFRLRFQFRLDYRDQWSPDPRFMKRQTRFDSKIDSWINYALEKKVEVLDLNFLPPPHSYYDEYYKLPSNVLTSGSLTELKLASCVMRPQADICMRSLESLSLTKIQLSRDTMEKILSRCPLLKNLSLIEIKCDGLYELSITSERLICLMVVRSSGSRLEISCPFVTSINISGWIDGIDLKNSSSLVDATLEFTKDPPYSSDEHHRLGRILQDISHVKVLTICDRLTLVLSEWELKDLPCQSYNWKCLVLKTRLTKKHLPGIVRLLRNSPRLEMLTIYIHPNGPPFCALPSNEIDEEYFRVLAEPSFYCPADSLKTVTLYGYVAEHWAIQVVQFLLKSAMVLEKMTISTKRNVNADHWNHFTSEKMQEFSERLSNFPRGSTCAEILVS